MGEAVECEGLTHEKFDVATQLNAFVETDGILMACGTCLKSRMMDASDVCPLSTMLDCVELVEWAEEIITF